jgi:hypothetical protein
VEVIKKCFTLCRSRKSRDNCELCRKRGEPQSEKFFVYAIEWRKKDESWVGEIAGEIQEKILHLSDFGGSGDLEAERLDFPRIKAAVILSISKYKQRGSERIDYKLESEKGHSVDSHQITADIIRGKTVAKLPSLPSSPLFPSFFHRL